MSEIIKIKIYGNEIEAKKGQMILEAAANNGIYIPTLCSFDGVKPKSSCRICTVIINGRPLTACFLTVLLVKWN